jgi:hypothetical protein
MGFFIYVNHFFKYLRLPSLFWGILLTFAVRIAENIPSSKYTVHAAKFA